MSVTGANAKIRERISLFFCNILNRHDDHAHDVSDYKNTHIFQGDTLLDMQKKSAMAKDSIIIAFQPSAGQIDKLYKMYSAGIYNEEVPVCGTLLLVQDKPIFSKNTKDLRIVEINIGQIKKAGNLSDSTFFSTLNPEDSDFIDNIKSFIIYLAEMLTEDPDYVQQKYNEFYNKKIRDSRYKDFSPETRNIALELNFALYLYCLYHLYYRKKQEKEISDNQFKSIISKWYEEHENIILNTVKKSIFTPKGEQLRSKSEEIAYFCSYINKYMQKNKNFVAKANEESRNVTNIRIWYDDEYIFMTAQIIKEILKLMDADILFNKALKELLAEKDIIKVYKENSRIEYSTHYQKPLYDNKRIKDRFIMFNREKCKEYNLFPYIEDTFPVCNQSIIVEELKSTDVK